jgi:hypothetical protein
MRREFLDPINKYRGQYREIDERMRERRRRADEVDKLQDQVKKYGNHSPPTGDAYLAPVILTLFAQTGTRKREMLA